MCIRDRIHAFTGECGALECLDNFNYENIYSFSRITFTVDTSESIFFYLEHIDSSFLEPSIFFYGVAAEKGEICDDGIWVDRDTMFTMTFENAVFNFNSCTNETKKDKWITLQGDGRRVVIYRNKVSNLHVYEGGCDSLVCSLISQGVTQFIQTEMGKIYNIAVSEPLSFFSSSENPLDIRIQYYDAPINENYEDAILLSCGDSIMRNFDAVAQIVDCDYGSELWYELPQSEGILEINLSPRGAVRAKVITEIDGELACEELVGFSEKLIVPSEEGKKKLVAVSPIGINSNFTPTFELTINCFEAAENDEVEGAIIISCNDTITASLLNSSPSALDCIDNSIARDIWYKVVGNDNIYTCLLYTSPSPRDRTRSRMPSSA